MDSEHEELLARIADALEAIVDQLGSVIKTVDREPAVKVLVEGSIRTVVDD